MKLFGKHIDREVVIIAEIGVNHEGDVESASRLLRLAAETGADAAKFQTYTPARFFTSSTPERLETVTSRMIDEAAHRRLAKEAEALGIVFFSSAITEDVIPLLDELCPVIKIASGDLTFEPVIRAAARTGKPVILSTGTGIDEEIDRAVGWFREEVGLEALRDRLVLMQCTSAYPVVPDEANLSSIPYLRERHGLRVGYSNHVIGLDACLASIPLGACVIEAHFTDQKEGREFRDHQLSLDPDDMADLVRRVPIIRSMMGTYGKQRQPSESDPAIFRKGIVAARDLAAGTELCSDDLMFARPASEITSGEIKNVLGRRLTDGLKYGEQLPRAILSD